METTMYISLLFIVLLFGAIKPAEFEESNVTSDDIIKNIEMLVNQTVIQYSEIKDYVFVVGKTGVGKTPFVKWQCEDNRNLWSVREDKYSPYLMEGTFNNESMTSQTLYPDLFVVNNNTIAWYDFPGFKDTRGPDYELVTGYFIKQLSKRAKNVKIIFVVDFNALVTNQDRDEIMDQITSFVNFLTDLDKYSKSLMLVVTQVPTLFQNEDFTNDTEAIEEIIGMLKDTRDQYKDTNANSKFITLIDILIPNVGIFRYANETGRYSEIEILKPGKAHVQQLVRNLTFAQASADDFSIALSDESANMLQEVIHKILENKIYPHMLACVDNATLFLSKRLDINTTGINYAELSRDIDGFMTFLDGRKKLASVADFAQKLEQVRVVSPELSLILGSTLDETRRHVESVSFLLQIAETTQIREEEPTSLRSKMALASANLRSLVDNAITKFDNMLVQLIRDILSPHFSQQERNLKKFDDILNITRSTLAQLNTFIDDVTKICGLLSSMNSSTVNLTKIADFAPLAVSLAKYKHNDINEVATALGKLTDDMRDRDIWYTFLTKFAEDLTTRAVDGNWQGLANVADVDFPKGKRELSQFLEEKTNNCSTVLASGLGDMKGEVEGLKMQYFHAVKNTFLDYELAQVEGASSDVFRVAGNNVKMSEVWKRAQRNGVKAIDVFAMNRVFLDETIQANGVKLTIVAPMWEVGSSDVVTVSLNGQDGEDLAPAVNSQALSDNGTSGRQGNPGRPGGHFFGVGDVFLKPELLRIEANGGDGGDGQDGGRGFDGVPGIDMPETYCERFDDYCSYYWAQNVCLRYPSNSKCSSFEPYTDIIMSNLNAISVGHEGVNTCPYVFLNTWSSKDTSSKCIIRAGVARKSTAGGNGGPGGLKGLSGCIDVISLDQDPIGVVGVQTEGQYGEPGSAGVSGVDVRDDEVWKIIKTVFERYTISGDTACQTAAYVKLSSSTSKWIAPKATPGNNSEMIGESEKALSPIDKGEVINAFVKYMKSRLAEGFVWKSHSSDWLANFVKNEKIRQLVQRDD